MRKLIAITMFLQGVTLTAQAHTSMCDHKHSPNGTIHWDCPNSKNGKPNNQNDHSQHVRHGMVLFGETNIFASHIVYKAPHNFQVVLEIRLSSQVNDAYSAARREFPMNKLVLVLDALDISLLGSTKLPLAGTIFREDQQGNKFELISGVKIGVPDYDIVYFDELPLSLAPN